MILKGPRQSDYDSPTDGRDDRTVSRSCLRPCLRLGRHVRSVRAVRPGAWRGTKRDLSVFGQESNPTTWRLAHMNLAIRGIEARLGDQPADTFLRDQHPDLKADFVLANPPFNVSGWCGA